MRSREFTLLICRMPGTPELLGATRAEPGEMIDAFHFILVRNRARELWLWPVAAELRSR